MRNQAGLSFFLLFFLFLMVVLRFFGGSEKSKRLSFMWFFEALPLVEERKCSPRQMPSLRRKCGTSSRNMRLGNRKKASKS